MKSKMIVVVTAFLGLAIVSSAQAQEVRLNVGVRGSFGVPFGEARGGTDLKDVTTRAIPVQVDVDYRIDEHWSAGVYAIYGPVAVADATRRQLAASGLRSIGGHRQQRVGVQLTRTFRPAARVSPWVGMAAGYDWTRYAWAKLATGEETEIGVSGFETTLQGGASFKLTPRLAIGPFAAFDLGRYGQDIVWVQRAGNSSTGIPDKGLHQWVRFGVKMSVGF
ncbi:MAG TPA: hypothetical protein PKK95_10260 [Vicinamibacterales bacterium]|nr:hypothetical protein [Vicinamibacterales bacterium]